MTPPVTWDDPFRDRWRAGGMTAVLSIPQRLCLPLWPPSFSVSPSLRTGACSRASTWRGTQQLLLLPSSNKAGLSASPSGLPVLPAPAWSPSVLGYLSSHPTVCRRDCRCLSARAPSNSFPSWWASSASPVACGWEKRV